MDQLFTQLLDDLAAHKFAAALITLAIVLAAALNTKASWFPKSLPQGWRTVTATGLTIVAVVGDKVLDGAGFVEALTSIGPWLVAAVGVLATEIGYARKGLPVPPEVVLPPAPKVSGRRLSKKAGAAK